MKNIPTKINVVFIISNHDYLYSITSFDYKIKEESLHRLNFGKKDDELSFERNLRDKNIQKITLAPRYLKNGRDKIEVEVWEDFIQHDQLFISFVNGKKYKDINEAHLWLTENLICFFPGAQFSALINMFVTDDNFKGFINNIVNTFETGIQQIDVQTLNFNVFFGVDNIAENDRILKKIRAGETENVGSGKTALAMMAEGKPVVKKVVTYHTNSEGEKVEFELGR